jgi:hypothetical protein
VRIARTSGKVVYVLGGGFVAIALTFAGAFLLPRLAEVVVGAAIEALFYLIAVRSFRGRNEPVHPPRAWWRMTALPRAGFVLGGLLALDTAFHVLAATSDHSSALNTVLTVIVEGGLSVLYISSSIRLLRIAKKETQMDWAERISRNANTPS